MNKEEMIKAIYKKVADKTLSFGCKVIPKSKLFGINDNFRIIHFRGDCYRLVYKRYFEGGHCEDFIDSNLEEIIGHPVMINRIEYILPKNDYLEIRQSISKDELLLPIDNWNIEAINLLYKKVGF